MAGQETASTSTDLAQDDRRRHRRVAWRHYQSDPLLIEIQEPGDDWKALPCTIVDVGGGGLGMLVDEPVTPGSRVRVTFPLPEQFDGEDDAVLQISEAEPWMARGEIVHTRHTPESRLAYIPDHAHRRHHHGVRFHELEEDAETRLMHALYGPMPKGWAVERYTPLPSAGAAAAREDGPRQTAPTASQASEAKQANSAGTTYLHHERYAVIHNGKRVARGFATYDHARARAWSLHLDDLALASRKPRSGP